MRAALGKGHDSFEMDQRKEPATPHPGPLPVRGGEGEAFACLVWFAVSFATLRLGVFALKRTSIYQRQSAVNQFAFPALYCGDSVRVVGVFRG